MFIIKINNVFLLFTLAIITTGYSIPDDCTDFGPTLSNVTICNGNICNFTEILSDTIDFIQGSKACYKFISPDPTVPPAYLNIVINNAYVRYNSDYHYVTGDSVVNSQGYCGCPLGTSVSCSNCPVTGYNGAYNTCFDGNHQDGDCILNHLPGGHGTFCVKRYYQYNRDIQVFHLNSQKTIVASVEVDFNGTSWIGDYSGFQVQINQEEFTSVAIKSSSVFPVYEPEFLLWHADEAYYVNKVPLFLLKSDYVNSLLECNVQKIGWIKPDLNPPICSEFRDMGQNNITIASCDNNVFAIPNPFVSAGKLLQELNQYQVNKIDDRILVVNKDYQDQVITNGTHLNGIFRTFFATNTIKTIGFPVSGRVSPLGKFDDYEGPFFDILSGQLVLTGTTSCFVSVIRIEGIGDNDKTVNLALIRNEKHTGICAVDNDLCPTYDYHNPCFYDCLVSNITLLEFPSFNRILLDLHTFETYDNQTQFNKSTDTSVYIPIESGSLSFNVIFSGLTVNFETSTTKPIISSIEYEEPNLIIVYARSITTPGRCYLTSPDLFFIPKPIDLSLNNIKYYFELENTVAIGNFNFTIRCANYFFSKQQLLNINNTVDPSINSSLSETTPNNIWNPFNWDNIDMFSTWDWIKKISIIIGLILFLVATVLLTVKILYCMKERKKINDMMKRYGLNNINSKKKVN